MDLSRLEHHVADINGVELHWVATGEGPLVLFLHGFPEFWYGWRHQLTGMGEGFRCVAPDQRGYNLSAKPDGIESYRIRHLIGDVAALADRLSPNRRFVLVAHDWGGAVAWAYALKHPGRLAGLVIMNATHPATFQRELRNSPAQRAASDYMGRFRDAGIEERLSANDFAELWSFSLGPLEARGLIDPATARAYRDAWARPGALTAMLNWYRAMRLNPDEDPAKAKAPYDESALVVKVPTLVLWGMRDHALLPGCIEGLDAYVPDLQLVRFPEATHWIAQEEAAAVTDHIRRFAAARLGHD